MRRVTSVETTVAHLVGPGRIKVVNEQLAYSAAGQSAIRLAPGPLQVIYCYGSVGVTHEALRLLWQHEIQTAWLTLSGTRCLGRLVRDDPSKASLRLLQQQMCVSPSTRLSLARWLVEAKLRTQADATRHYQRHGYPEAGPALQQIQERMAQCATATNLDVLRGHEGAATAVWFDLFSHLLCSPWKFVTRVRRPPTDPVNALLSLGYTLLLARVTARCEAAGLELYLGALHSFRAGRPSLSCDLMEPLRLPSVDRWVLRQCNEGRARPDGFVSEGIGIRLRPELFGPTLNDWENQWQNGGHESELERLMARLIERLRSQTLSPVSPLAEESGEV